MVVELILAGGGYEAASYGPSFVETISTAWHFLAPFLKTAIIVLSMSIGLFFVFAGTLGVIRMPDFFTRIHAAGMTDTLGVELILLGLIIQSGFTLLSLKFLLVGFFLLLTSPTATHAIADAAHAAGLKALTGRYRSSPVADIRQPRQKEQGGKE